MMETVGNGRDRKGRFIKGSCPNPKGKNGVTRKDKELEADFYKILQTTVTAQDFREIIEKTVYQAKRGNYQARKHLFEYILGAPENYVNVLHDGLPDIIVFDPHEPATND